MLLISLFLYMIYTVNNGKKTAIRKRNENKLSNIYLWRTMQSLSPLERSFLKIPRGSFDKYEKLSVSRKKWALRLAIRFGSVSWSSISDESPPPYYGINKIGKINFN